ncbi:NifU family protein [[Mycobacterium] wendilense]|uniref:NifU family protein n=1 Tax=[Mycobacterium] wendilense TaxID=3064284 RepID=A0ABM9MG53_9MYCO|nr:NifU family protein [Mycolicibacterium sp. MU0050]CAJ1584348.1 NifU family protein [Mycolicibacterium sp. MU0050]
MTGRASPPGDDGRWRTAGDRIETLLDAAGTGTGGPRGRERAEQLVREVVELYGEALQRIVAMAEDHHLEQLAEDDLVASLLLVHGLHPHDLRRRISDALDRVRPYLGSHGGDVDLLEITSGPEGATVRLRFTGSCKSCPSSAITLELAVEDAVRAAAPEVTAIEVVAAPDSPSEPAAAVIPAESLLGRVRAHPTRTSWHPVPDIADLAPGEVGGFDVGPYVVLACLIGDNLYAYRDHCPSCDDSMAGAVLHRVLGSRDPVLRCPHCGAHYDVVHAGAGLAETTGHLEPLPLLVRDGVLSLAMDVAPTGVSA